MRNALPITFGVYYIWIGLFADQDWTIWAGSKFFLEHRTSLSVVMGLFAVGLVRSWFPRTSAKIPRRYRNPPPNAEFLFYLFLDAKNCDALVGDLEERYQLIHTKFGKHRANFWYWTQALRSVGPIVWAWVQKIALKPILGVAAWAVARGLIGQDSLWGLLVDLWRRIRL